MLEKKRVGYIQGLYKTGGEADGDDFGHVSRNWPTLVGWTTGWWSFHGPCLRLSVENFGPRKNWLEDFPRSHLTWAYICPDGLVFLRPIPENSYKRHLSKSLIRIIRTRTQRIFCGMFLNTAAIQEVVGILSSFDDTLNSMQEGFRE